MSECLRDATTANRLNDSGPIEGERNSWRQVVGAHIIDLSKESYCHRYRSKLQRNSSERRTWLFSFSLCINPLLQSHHVKRNSASPVKYPVQIRARVKLPIYFDFSKPVVLYNNISCGLETLGLAAAAATAAATNAVGRWDTTERSRIYQHMHTRTPPPPL